ncbi:glycoside hydrolase family 113 [Anaerocolumna cellulosilytica]
MPNDWSLDGDINLQGQAEWYKKMFEKTAKRDWAWKQYHIEDADKDSGYDLYGKPAEAVVKEYYRRKG